MSSKLSASAPTSRRLQRARTRATLLDAAQAAFAELGFNAATIADITTRAGVASGTFYVHFKSKDAVLDELLEAFNARLAERLTPLFQPPGDAELPALVRTTAEIFLEHWDDNRSFVAAYAQRSATGVSLDDFRGGINPQMLRLLRSALQAAADRGGGCLADLDLVTHALLAMWLRVGLQVLYSERVSRAAAVDTLVQLTVGAVRGVLGKESP